MSPTSRPWRCSSTTVINAGFVCVIDATRQAAPGSPSASVTVQSSPAWDDRDDGVAAARSHEDAIAAAASR